MEIDKKKIGFAVIGSLIGFVIGFIMTMIVQTITIFIVLGIIVYLGLKAYMIISDKKSTKRYEKR